MEFGFSPMAADVAIGAMSVGGMVGCGIGIIVCIR